MSEPIPMWEDWRFWQIVVTGALAFLGFTFGTWVKDWFDRRRDEARRDHENALRDEEKVVFAIAFRAELGTLLTEANVRLSRIDRQTPTKGVHMVAFDIPAKAVYANNTHRLGELGRKVAALVIHAHGSADHIRQFVDAARAYPSKTELTAEYVNAVRGNFLRLTRHVEQAHNALDLFLGDPKRYPVLTDVPAEPGPASAAAEPDPAGAAAKPAEPDPEPAP